MKETSPEKNNVNLLPKKNLRILKNVLGVDVLVTLLHSVEANQRAKGKGTLKTNRSLTKKEKVETTMKE